MEAAIRSHAQRRLAAAAAAVEEVCARARERVAARVAPGGGIDPERLTRFQTAAHGLAWYDTYRGALAALAEWLARLEASGQLGPVEGWIAELVGAEYLGRIRGGLPMSPGEYVRPWDLGLEEEELAALQHPELGALMVEGRDRARLERLAEAFREGRFGAWGLDLEELELVRDQFHRFAEERVRPEAQSWHLEDRLIPMELIDELAQLGVFGLTVPEAYGGLGMGKLAMCVVSEELSRGSLAVGSLATRSEIAAELILRGGREDQRQSLLPRIARGEVIPTAVFTEPDAGSDLARIQTRAVLTDGMWRVYGAKTWITHAARADLMTLLVRTEPDREGHRGLSILLAEKPRGTDEEPFPVEGLSGSEIPVLGYRGMKEYALSFDGFRVPEGGLLGAERGCGFRQLMATFESARIQTAARAVGVAQSALEEGVRYASERRQFGRPIIAFPRVFAKLAWMGAEVMAARQLTFQAARAKDGGGRSDREAGLAKLLSAQVAWTAADNALQIHGGNGYALAYPISRILCDARILNIFEGAAEIQAQVIARRLLA